jgi:SAM-dependent methyltransferase
MRRADQVEAETMRAAAELLVGLLDSGATVADIGPGSGGMSAAFAVALAGRGGGTVVLVDAVPELLDAAQANARAALASAGGKVEVITVQVDAASDDLPDLLPQADLVWASRVVHHLPDQQKGIAGLTRVLADGGWLALGEGGLRTRCLPWDLGVGEPGLPDRLAAAYGDWFADMRANMAGVKRMPVGWTKAMVEVGLSEAYSFSFLIDHPAPPSDLVRQSVVDWLTWVTGVAAERMSSDDQLALTRLLDPADPVYVGARDDVFILGASTVYLGRKPSSQTV